MSFRRMSFFECIGIAFYIFLYRISADNCPKIRLIQPLDESTGLSYAIVAGGKYYMITEEQLKGTHTRIRPLDLPENFENSEGAMIYFNQFCSPPENYMLIYRMDKDKNGAMFDWSIYLTLTNWTQRQPQWTKPSRFLPDFLQNNGYMNYHRFSFSMFWHKRSVLYRIQMPVEGARQEPHDYHTIRIKYNNTCDNTSNEYLTDEMKITVILEPFDDFEACFIHNDKQIICFGPKGFTAYDIDLKETKGGQLRVTNMTKDFEPIPIMKIIEDIREKCNELNETVLPPQENTTDFSETETAFEEPITEITPENSSANSSIVPSTKSSNDKSSFFWLYLLLLILFLIIISAIILWCCFKRKPNQKDDVSPIGGQPSDLDQNSNMSMRSQMDDKNKLNQSSIGSGPSMRSVTNTKDKTVANKDMSNSSSIDNQQSMRSQGGADDKTPGIGSESTIEPQFSMRSQTPKTDKKNATQDMSNPSAIDNQQSMRSQVGTDNKSRGIGGQSAIEPQISMRSQTSKTDKKNTTQDMGNASAIDNQQSMRSQVGADNKTSGIGGQSAIEPQLSMRSQTQKPDKKNSTQDMSNASAIEGQPSVRSQNESNTKPVSQNSAVDQSAIDSSVSMRSVNENKQNPNQQ